MGTRVVFATRPPYVVAQPVCVRVDDASMRSPARTNFQRPKEKSMKRVVSLFAAAAMTIVTGASAVEAQSPIRFGLAGGLSLPQGDLDNTLKSGFHGQAMLGFGMMMLPVKLRADLSYHSLAFEGIGAGDPDLRVLSGALNAIVGMGGIGVKPYVTGGLGFYNSKFGSGTAANDFGLNGGVGLEFSLTGMSTFLEARYVKVLVDGSGNFAFVPITFGIMF
jgi:outer membrane protein with beta-barrel domain